MHWHRLGVALLSGAMAVSIGLATTNPRVSAASSVSWNDLVGVSSPDASVQGNAYLSRELWIDAGDTVNWTLNSEEFHTVTFLSGGDQPPLITGDPPDINPVVAAPAGTANYAGTGYFNSGLMAVPGQSYSLTFTHEGTFPFICLVHANMSGVIHVQASGSAYPHDQAYYDRSGKAEGQRVVAAGKALAGRARGANAGPTTVTMGTGAFLDPDTSVAVMRFEQPKTVVHIGDTVQWVNRDPQTPHTVTFGTEPPGGPIGAFAPSGVAPYTTAVIDSTSQSVNSGVIGANLPFGTTFSARFTSPGTYRYICALHDDLGMVGEVVVLP